MKTQLLRIRGLIPVMVGAWTALVGPFDTSTAHGGSEVRLSDIARCEFSRPRVISGLGVVTGLQDTGDTGKNYQAARAYLEMIDKARITDEEGSSEAVIKAGSIALVIVTATVKEVETGGTMVTCTVAAAGNGATSLAGGQLLQTPLRDQAFLVSTLDRDETLNDVFPVLGLASGRLRVLGEDQPTRATIDRGAEIFGPRTLAQLEFQQSLRQQRDVVFDIKNPALRSLANAQQLVDVINDELMKQDLVDLASIQGPGSVVVRLPEHETDAFRFAAELERTHVDFQVVRPEATIRWSGETLVISGNTRIHDTLLAVDGFRIERLEPAREPTLDNPAIETETFLTLSQRERPPLSLQSLKRQLDRLKVPARKQAEILKILCDNGDCTAVFIDESGELG